MAAQNSTSLLRAAALARVTRRYALSVLPAVHAERRLWLRRAEQIPNRVLRGAALDSLHTKRDVLEGAASFAVFVKPSIRARVVRAIAAFEIAFDYLDGLMELPNADPVLNCNTLCRALWAAFDPAPTHVDYYEHHTAADDGDYLVALIEACGTTLAQLPCYPVVGEMLHRALSQVVTYQSLHHSGAQDSHGAFREWVCAHADTGVDMRWWELGAALGSQLSLLALIAAAADSTLSRRRAAEIEHAYFPWIAALSTLLDSVVDRHRDHLDAQRSLVDYYSSPQEAAERLRWMTVAAMRSIRSLDDVEDRTVMLAAMIAFFHSAAQPAGSEAQLVTRAILDTVGAWGTPPLLFLKVRSALAGGPRARGGCPGQRGTWVSGPRVNLSDGDERSGLLGDVCGGGLGDLAFDCKGELGEAVVADDPSELSLSLEHPGGSPA